MDKSTLSPSQPWILWLGAPGSEQASLVGGKAAALARLAGRYLVPPGFCLTALTPPSDGVLASSTALRIREEYVRLSELCGTVDVAVAVRSSAVDEDGQHASFAGMHDTFLNVSGADAVVDAVARCARSAISERALAYRALRGLTSAPVQIAVLVQRFVVADASLVAFSRNPLSFNDDEIVINAVWGLGEGVVSGSITPEIHVVRRRDRVVTQQVCGRQTTEVFPVPGGTAVRELAPGRRGHCSLGEQHVATICDWVVRLEAEFGERVDVEGARVGDSLFLLQCRPITTGFPVRWEREEDRHGTWLREDIHFPHVVSPAGGEYASKGMYAGLARMQREQGWPSRAEARVFNGYVYVNWLYLVTHGELQVARQQLKESNQGRAHGVLRDWNKHIRPRLQAIYEWIDSAAIETAPTEEASRLWDRLWELVEEAWYLHFRLLYPCMAAARYLEAVCTESFVDVEPQKAARLTQGRLEKLYEVQEDLYSLSQGADAARVLSLLGQGTAEQVYHRLASTTEAPSFMEALSRFIAKHGHLGAEVDDLSVATWADEPWRVLGELRRMSGSGETPSKRQGRLLAESDSWMEELRWRLHDSEAARRTFEQAVALARAVTPLIEDHNYWIDRMLHAKVRTFYLRVGRRLCASNVCSRPEDVFLLHTAELQALLSRPEDRRSLIRRRAEDMQHHAQLKPPMLLTTQPGVDDEQPPSPDAVDVGVIRGIPASLGAGRGPARVIRSSVDLERVQPGDVLVCHNVNLSFVAFLPMLSAIVASSGGMLSHAAIVARELQIPAVVGLGGATEMIQEDVLVEVDGGAGTVRIVSDFR